MISVSFSSIGTDGTPTPTVCWKVGQCQPTGVDDYASDARSDVLFASEAVLFFYDQGEM